MASDGILNKHTLAICSIRILRRRRKTEDDYQSWPIPFRPSDFELLSGYDNPDFGFQV